MRFALAVMALALVAACSPRPASPRLPTLGAAPPAAPAPARPGDTTIGVGPDGTYTINGQPTHAKNLQEALEEVARRDAEADKAARGGK